MDQQGIPSGKMQELRVQEKMFVVFALPVIS